MYSNHRNTYVLFSGFYSKPHNDLPFPHKSFIEERRDSTNFPDKPASESADKRKLFTYVVLAGLAISCVCCCSLRFSFVVSTWKTKL